jgi:anti-sigma B factor antagonist
MSEEYQVILNYEGATPVIRLKGEITSEAEDALVSRYEEIPADRRARVILDFQETRYINSSGIAILIQLITRAADARNRIDFSSHGNCGSDRLCPDSREPPGSPPRALISRASAPAGANRLSRIARH